MHKHKFVDITASPDNKLRVYECQVCGEIRNQLPGPITSIGIVIACVTGLVLANILISIF